MTALDTRRPEDDLDLTPWVCPRCGYANGGIRGMCAGCRSRRPAPELEPEVRRSTPRPTSRRGARPTPPARHGDIKFGAREIVATVLIVIVFVGGVLTAIVRSTDHTSSPATAPSGSSASQWDPRVLDVVQFVERRRGLQFKHPVPMTFLDDAAFDKTVTTSGSPSVGQQSELNDTLATLRAVGLAEGAPDLQAA